MAEKTASSDRNDSAAPASGPTQVRNVVLVGPSGGGKTTLAEAMLLAAGAINRAGTVAAGTTVCDSDEAEIRQQRSISLALAPLVYDGIKINVIDTPGYADFVGELRAGLRAADAALFVVAANEVVDTTTVALWRECADVSMPRAVVITKLDHQRADYDEVLAEAQGAFEGKVLPLDIPRYPDELIGLLTESTTKYAADGTRTVEAGADDTGDLRGSLIEGVIEESEDEGLMERYLGGESIDTAALVEDLERAIAKATLFPVIPVCGPTLFGVHELLGVITRAFPFPGEHQLPDVFTPAGAPADPPACDPSGRLLAEVVKTSSDPYVGRVSLVRVFSGTVRPDLTVHVSGHLSSILGTDRGHPDHDEDERVGTLTIPFGKTFRPATAVVAGDICAIGRLSRAETGDTLSDKESPLVLRPWTMPEPLLPIAVQAHAKADEDKLSQGLTRLGAEDPTLRIENNARTHQLVLWCMGEAHADVVLDQLRNRYGAAVDVVELKVPLRETFANKAKGLGRHVKQSGGHGQYAVCHIEIEPLDDPLAFEFVDRVVGGAVPRQYISSVEKGIRAQMERGIATGNPLAGFRAILVDGKAHSVDSSDAAFQTAGSLALKDAAANARVSLLEPVDTVDVQVPDDLVGTVMSDLSGRRGRLLGTEALEGRTLVRTEVPAIELRRYPVDLRTLTHGTATFTRSFVRFEPMPESVARTLVPT
jgi:elongation factor G